MKPLYKYLIVVVLGLALIVMFNLNLRNPETKHLKQLESIRVAAFEEYKNNKSAGTDGIPKIQMKFYSKSENGVQAGSKAQRQVLEHNTRTVPDLERSLRLLKLLESSSLATTDKTKGLYRIEVYSDHGNFNRDFNESMVKKDPAIRNFIQLFRQFGQKAESSEQ